MRKQSLGWKMLAAGTIVAALCACDEGSQSSSPQTASNPEPTTNTSFAFQQDSGSDGLVAMEAESYDANVAAGGYSWTREAVSSPSGYDMAALPDSPLTYIVDTNWAGNSPHLDFKVNFVKTGYHYVWVRMLCIAGSSCGSSDSVHVGIDQAENTTAKAISDNNANLTAWTWVNNTNSGVQPRINVNTVGLHTISIWMREDGVKVDKIFLTTNPAYANPGTGSGPVVSARTAVPFQQDSGSAGLLAMEAESYDAKVAAAGYSWTSEAVSSPSQGADMAALPDSPVSYTVDTAWAGNSPHLDFKANFVKTGVHYVWVRMLCIAGTNCGSSDSVHVGIDGLENTTAKAISKNDANMTTWTWVNTTNAGAAPYVVVGTPGPHTINVWMREDGVKVDKIFLTVDPNYANPGTTTGPAESARQSAPNCLGVDLGGTPAGSGTALPVANGGFEDATWPSHWAVQTSSGCAQVTHVSTQRSSGTYSIRYQTDTTSGCSATMTSDAITATGAGMYEVHGAVLAVTGTGMEVRVSLDGGSTYKAIAWHHGYNAGQWRQFSARFYVPSPGTQSLKIQIGRGSWAGSGTTDMYFDDLTLWHMPTGRPWSPEYALSATDSCRLTDADVVAPDGVVYPKWNQVGVRGGIPTYASSVNVSTRCQGITTCDAAADLRAAISTAATSYPNGAYVVFGAGTYYLLSPVVVSNSKIVIKGAGASSTHLLSEMTGGNNFWHGAITFAGGGTGTNPELLLGADAHRGDRQIILAPGQSPGLSAGDRIYVEAPPTDRWNLLVGNTCIGYGSWQSLGGVACNVQGGFRNYAAQVQSASGDVITLTQPLRFDLPVADSSYIQKVATLDGVGIENLELKQDQVSSNCVNGTPAATSCPNLVVFTDTWNSWVRGVTATKPGRFGIYFQRGKWCEVRDSAVNDAWWHGGNGSSYVGWDYSWDNLMDNVTTTAQRHAPIFQMGAAGNVVRNSRFSGSDVQYHAGWVLENLVENCVVGPTTTAYTYGEGVFGTDAGDGIHGPVGPRNVIYNSDIYAGDTGASSANRAGISLGGSNEAYLVVYNRFIVEVGTGFLQRATGFDHLISGNVFNLKDTSSPLVTLSTADDLGFVLAGNDYYGGDQMLSAGPVVPSGTSNAKGASPSCSGWPSTCSPARPMPAIASIYSWQLANVP
jgi:Gylcosyl hydrolase family 115 C-terminal domain/Right handed beta helix region